MSEKRKFLVRARCETTYEFEVELDPKDAKRVLKAYKDSDDDAWQGEDLCSFSGPHNMMDEEILDLEILEVLEADGLTCTRTLE